MRAAAGMIALLMLTACDGGGDPVQQALRETATVNQSAVVKYDDDSTRPVAAVETADQIWVAGTLADHRAALAKAEAVLRDSRDPEVRRLAEAVIDARTREIPQLEAWTPTPAP